LTGGRTLRVRATRPDGVSQEFSVTVRIDTPQEVLYYRHGGILQYVLRQLLAGHAEPAVVSAGMATGADPATGSQPT
jgi:aconitate hydratase